MRISNRNENIETQLYGPISRLIDKPKKKTNGYRTSEQQYFICLYNLLKGLPKNTH